MEAGYPTVRFTPADGQRVYAVLIERVPPPTRARWSRPALREQGLGEAVVASTDRSCCAWRPCRCAAPSAGRARPRAGHQVRVARSPARPPHSSSATVASRPATTPRQSAGSSAARPAGTPGRPGPVGDVTVRPAAVPRRRQHGRLCRRGRRRRLHRRAGTDERLVHVHDGPVAALTLFALAFVRTDFGIYVVIFSMLLSPQFGSKGAGVAPGVASPSAPKTRAPRHRFSWLAKTAVNKELNLIARTR